MATGFITNVRGYRLCNPGCIRIGPDLDGRKPVSSDPELMEFTSHVMGIRGIAKILSTYHRVHKLSTLRSIISRWAPPSENPTAQLISNACARTGLTADSVIDLSAETEMVVVVRAIIHQELGSVPYSDQTILEGVRAAGVTRVDIRGSAELKGGRIAIIGVIGTALTEATFSIQNLSFMSGWLQIICFLVIIGGVGFTIWSKLDDASLNGERR